MKRTFRILTLFIAVTLLISLFAGCSGTKETASDATAKPGSSENTVTTTPEPAKETNPTLSETAAPVDGKALPLKVSYRVRSQTIKDDDGTALMHVRVSYPVIDNPGDDKGIAAINEYYETQSEEFAASVVPGGMEAAREGKKSAKELGYDFYPFEYEKEASVYYNGNNLLSVLHVGYENTGGAHPSGYWASETFDVKTGKKLTLSDIYGKGTEEVLGKIYETVLAQIEEKKDTDQFIYYDTYVEDVKKNYSEGDFVLDHDGIIFYYQPYSIAPYAAGIPTFKVPYGKSGDLAADIPAVESKEQERELYTRAGRLIEANKEVFYDIFGLSMLQVDTSKKSSKDQMIFPVKDNRFKSYSELDSFIRGIYVKSEADSLMGSGRYIDRDGKLYADLSKDAGMGYYVDWSNYRYELSDISNNSANITIYTVDDSPAGREDKTINIKMLKEKDQWLLEKMFY